ncbi:hypothetical protein BDZ91DRAFT_712838 [Kalaharituber pfeilii]|nr:hypothetical protein BDZ91DRAFT_712838 [Kalaharituber pfeilii]
MLRPKIIAWPRRKGSLELLAFRFGPYITRSGCRKFTVGANCHKEAAGNADGSENDARAGIAPSRAGEDRDFYLSILKSSSTKREAKSYLQRFTPAAKKVVQAAAHSRIPDSSLQAPSSAEIKQELSPSSLLMPVNHKVRTGEWIQRILSLQQKITPLDFTYATASIADFFTPEITEDQIHLALVKIRQIQDIDDATLHGIGKTLVKLKKLGLLATVVIDPSSVEPAESGIVGWRKALQIQVERVVLAIERARGWARSVDGACSVNTKNKSSTKEEEVLVALPNLIIAPLSHGTTPVIAPIAYDGNQKSVAVNADSIILALTRLLSAEQIECKPNTALAEPSLLSVDRIIYIDPLGGIPSKDRPNNSAHVFLNLQQEYESVREELMAPMTDESSHRATMLSSKLLEEKKTPVPARTPDTVFFRREQNIHLQNLTTLRIALSMLPSNSSAMITTPAAAATASNTKPSTTNASARSNIKFDTQNPSQKPVSSGKALADRNPLIHNLLTDKPVFSSSLPISSPSSPYTTTTTLLKHGIPLSILTNPAYPATNEKIFKLTDGTIDLDRLVYLIEDSFGRKLDVENYLARVDKNIAGLIVAGEYEGAAIVTWETDGLLGRDGNKQMSGYKKVPYLDKFAVLRKSQGSGGVADVVFKAMVMGVFPGHGIVWRSRVENVVNKWYFERAKGSFKVPGTGWTMFWTGGSRDGVGADQEKFEQYMNICKNVRPSFKS